MIKDLFTGSLGKLNNHGGSRIYTTPNTILVPPEYEVDIGKHGDFVSCTLDGRLWLFKDKIIALKWNEETGKMEFSASRSFNNNQFIARGIDWILTKTYIIQYNDGKIVVEAHKIKDIQPMENFYSLLPAIDGFQIIKGYLIRKPGAEYEKLIYPIENNFDFLTFKNNEVWFIQGENIGKLEIVLNEKDEYNSQGVKLYFKFNTEKKYSNKRTFCSNIIFLDDDLYGFQSDENNKGLCYCTQELFLYSYTKFRYKDVSDIRGKIYFDVFNQKAIVLHDKGMEILPDEKKIECNALEQWIAPSKELYYVSNNIIISAISNKVLVTNLTSKFYRSLLKANKELPLTATAYQNNKEEVLKLAIGIIDNKLNFNSLNVMPFFPFSDIEIEVELLNAFEHDFSFVSSDEYAVFIAKDKREYVDIFLSDNVGMAYINTSLYKPDSNIYPPYTVFLSDSGIITYKNEANSGYITKLDYQYFNINLDTGKYVDKNIDKSFTVETETFDCYYTTHFFAYGEEFKPLIGKTISIKGIDDLRVIFENNILFINSAGSKKRVVNGLSSVWLERSSLEYFSEIIDTFSVKYDIISTKNEVIRIAIKNGYIVFNYYVNENEIKNQEIFSLNAQQKDLLKQYPNFLQSFDYFRGENEFSHILIFSKNEEKDKCLFFVFRTKLKTRSKL